MITAPSSRFCASALASLLTATSFLPAPALGARGDRSADVAVTMVDAPDPVQPGKVLTYRIVVGNRGSREASGVTMRTSVPLGTEFDKIEAPAGWTVAAPPRGESGAVTATRPSLPEGPPVVFQVSVRVPPDTPVGTTIANSASVTSESPDSDGTNDSAESATTVALAPASVADISVLIESSPTPVQNNGQIVYTYVVDNAGPNLATDVVLTAPVPQGTTFVSVTSSAGTCTAPEAGGTGEVTCAIDAVGLRRPLIVTAVVQVTARVGLTVGAVARVTALSADPRPTDNTAADAVRIVPAGPPADVSVTIAGSADPVPTGSELTYTVTVHNAGPSAAERNTVVIRTAPKLRFLEATTEQGLFRAPPVGSGGPVGWKPGTIAPGASATLTLVVAVSESGGARVGSSATVTSGASDSNPGNDTAVSMARIQSAGEAEIRWDPPDTSSGGTPAPINIVVTPSSGRATKSAGTGTIATAAPAPPACYNVYSSTSSTVEPTAGNLFTTVPASQTVVNAPVSVGGTYYTVTACYTTGESASSGSAGAGTTPGARLTSLKYKNGKLTATGTGFTDAVEVLLDGLPFASAATVKNGKTKVVQKGTLADGQTVDDYLEPGQSFLVTFRNSDGGVTTASFTAQ